METTKTIFWNVDTQEDFMEGNAAYSPKLAVPNSAIIRPTLATITKIAKENGITVVNTRDWHDQNTSEISAEPNWTTTFPEHCMQDSYGANFIIETMPPNAYEINWKDKEYHSSRVAIAQNIILNKDHFDIFQGNPHTDHVLAQLNPQKVVVYGVATNVCVNYAVLGLSERGRKQGFEVYVISNAIKELPVPVEPVYATWRNAGAKFTTSTDLEKLIRK